MKIAYFVNQYPKVSHSFIRREILALEALGHSIERFSLRSDESELVDALDREEFKKTRYLLKQSFLNIAIDCLNVIWTNPLKFLQVCQQVIKMGWRSDRGILRHFFYLAESCVLLRWQKQAAIEHIHAHFGTNSTTVVMFAYLLGGAGYSFTVHGPEEFDKPEFIGLATKIHYSRFVAAISSYGRSQLFRWIPAEQWSKVKVIHCGLDASFLENHQQPDINLPAQIVCVGRLCEQKGQLLLLQAFQKLRQAGCECKLVLAGDGEMRAELERQIACYQLEDCVEITGWLSGEQVKTILLASKGLVLPSFAEGLPVVIMEALALRKPVISTYIAAIPELIEPGKNGWLVPAGDVDSLVQAMQALLSASPVELVRMGELGFKAVNEQHNISKEAAKLAALFAQTLS
jgi:glycosyltransferase involved in cell wall biosynthesis